MYDRTRIQKHLRSRDPGLEPILHHIRKEAIALSRTPFKDLAEAIINQQLSEGAGRTIFTRFCSLFPRSTVTPENLLAVPDQKLRDMGVSWSKVAYLKSLARAVADGNVTLGSLIEQTDEEVIRQLTQIKGIGRWTAEMFLMFSLGREDVFSFGDLGLRKAIQSLYKLKKEPTDTYMMRLTSKWKPYRTYVALALWAFKDQ